MAANKTAVESKNQELKHLGFVRIAAIQALVCVSNLYVYAKQNSGALRSTVGIVEGTVTRILSPVYDKFKGVPDDFLLFVDKKVDEAAHKLNEHAPPLAKLVASQAKGLIQKVTDKAEKVVKAGISGGPRAAIHYSAAETKQFILTHSIKLWIGLNHYPPFYAVAEMAVPRAAHWSHKYNHLVKDMTAKRFTAFGYLPLIPIDQIAKAFKQGDANMKQG